MSRRTPAQAAREASLAKESREPTLWDVFANVVACTVNGMASALNALKAARVEPKQIESKPIEPVEIKPKIASIADASLVTRTEVEEAVDLRAKEVSTKEMRIKEVQRISRVVAKPCLIGPAKGPTNRAVIELTSGPVRVPARAKKAPKQTQVEKYEAAARELLNTHGIRVRKWRSNMSGVAWELLYRDGSRVRLIEAPKPKGPMSVAILFHEVGHHVIGLGVYKPRCLEEYHAWRYAIDEMERRGFPVTDRVLTRYRRSMEYAVAKAQRRGIKSLPPEVLAFAKV